MRIGGHNLSNDIFFLGGHTFLAFTTSVLLAEIGLRDALHVILRGEQNDALLLGDELFFGEFARFVINNLTAALVTVFVFEGEELFLDDTENFVLIGEDGFEFLDEFVELLQFFFDLIAL